MRSRPEAVGRERLRAWLEHVAQQAIDWLDELDCETEDLEDDEVEVCPVVPARRA